ncbi:MAG: hypothetical protein KBA02_00320 [Paludibacteraceae bacterium]|nr:hypothetical protein [Paludibacteraceae bacterium]
MVKQFIPKEHPEIPDSYGVEVSFFGGKAEKYEVVSHRVVDKVFNKDALMGINPSPFWELVLKENDELICFPVNNCSVKFDGRWFKLIDLANKKQKGEK